MLRPLSTVVSLLCDVISEILCVVYCESAAAARRRKKRTSIDTIIRVELERRFNLNSKPTSEEIAMVADELQMEKEVVRVWYCNRRQKEKRINPPSAMTHIVQYYATTPPPPPITSIANGKTVTPAAQQRSALHTPSAETDKTLSTEVVVTRAPPSPEPTLEMTVAT